MPIFTNIQETELCGTKKVFLSAIRFATSTSDSFPLFEDDLRTSAQEQVEFMLEDDEKIPLAIADDEIKVEIGILVSKIFCSFENELFSLILEPDIANKDIEKKVMRSLSDLEWMCNTLLKMDLMKDFVSHWANISSNLLKVIEDKRLDSILWGLKIKLIEVTSKVLDAVGYGTVVLPAESRVELLKTWLPYIRKMKFLSDQMGKTEAAFPYKMSEDLSQCIEGAIVSLVSALPSNDQADILADWISAEQVKYPDLSEAFEIWCYRTKSANRRLDEALTESATPLSPSS
ncbi:BTB/POZ domain-containing protein At3g05675 isoform X1 [Nicotiana tabacum]|uniref:BTB/POZ domain-containing protein At3g05675 isoform X1 n=4 Tax=Nicotiana tabacum TaxID=4097 RepID=A0A1S4BEX0_TOBAC|nr:PREDICTED: BTB/POZ domain-containing protein At3g05675-like isoform X1 [Nicotiana tabacum]XP_016487367.1 PREDICTED: BTB/POZ domain-containing protein At3g05675-like isoform X1 [Nicotiana tabacum]XP_016487368.1 PREDICTED: BTB/POZ domain-containing protein At3g05675-like isoform X1 [Nicotiana tabacum]XP_016487369.1 PREDICTED: BTB/POZ domain-containing protein At3g05675-like isoform X1 [Nicotiana tabacum]XP_016487370.1 PREDICTED: BTB/POZ domain-containing protein At3g05675-like isoform X1 [Nico